VPCKVQVQAREPYTVQARDEVQVQEQLRAEQGAEQEQELHEARDEEQARVRGPCEARVRGPCEAQAQERQDEHLDCKVHQDDSKVRQDGNCWAVQNQNHQDAGQEPAVRSLQEELKGKEKEPVKKR